MTVWRTREILLDLCLVLAVLLLLYHRLLAPDVTLRVVGFTDLRFLSHPTYGFSGRSLAQGIFPFWNPYWFGGYPHFAMPEAALLYPTTLLFGLGSFMRVVELDVLAHLFLMGAGGYLLGRDLFARRLPALVFAVLLLAGTTGTATATGGRLWWMHLVAWAPLEWLLLRRILVRGQAGWALAFAAILALQVFAGSPQALVYLLAVFAVYTAAELLRRAVVDAEPLAQLARKGAFAFAAVALGLAMAAVQLLPSQDLLAHSIRSGGVTRDYFYGGARLSQALSARIFLDALLLRREALGFLPGALTLALVAYGLVRGRWGERLSFALVAGFCGLYMLLPAWAWEYGVRHLPGLGSGRFNTRISFFLYLSIYAFAGWGIAGLADARRREWGILALLVLLFSAAPLAGEPALRPLVLGVGASVAALAAFVARRPAAARWAPVGLALLVLVEGAHLHRDQMAYGKPRQLEIDRDFAAFSASGKGLDRTAIFTPVSFNLPLHYNLGSLTGDRLLGGYHGLMLEPYASFMQEVGGMDLFERNAEGHLQRQETHTRFTDWIGEESLRALDLLNVRYLASRGLALRVPEAEPQGGRRGFEQRRFGRLTVYENLDALPVAYVVHRAELAASDAAARARLRQPDFDPRSSVVLDGALDSFESDRLAPATGPEAVEVVSYGPNEVELRAELSAPGIVVLTDVHHPGWQVWVDADEAEPLRVNALVRGVFVPAGRHALRFVYRPSRLPAGLAVSSVAWLGWMAAAVALARLRRRGGP
jgi:hypothetical protein